MKGSTKRAFSILIASIFFIAGIGVYVYLIKPAYQDINLKRGELYTKTTQLSDYKNTISQMQKLLATYESLSQAQQSVSLMLPNDSSIPQAAYQISGLASMSGLNLQSMSLKELATTPSTALLKGMSTLRFSVKMTGTYESMKSFLQNLASNIRVFNVNTIKVEKLGNLSNVFTFNFELDAYYQTK
jgi:Tfp pilus assembly protein PilO